MATEQEAGDLRREVENLKGEVADLKGDLRASQQLNESYARNFSRVFDIYGTASDADIGALRDALKWLVGMFRTPDQQDAVKWLISMYMLRDTIRPGIMLLGKMLAFEEPTIQEMWAITRTVFAERRDKLANLSGKLRTAFYWIVGVLITAMAGAFFTGRKW